MRSKSDQGQAIVKIEASLSLPAPLSNAAKHLTFTPVRDMYVWVNRSPTVRHKETRERNGHVTRPMNSFMLYRSAYTMRTKEWCLQNKQQEVSKILGASWRSETPGIRNLYRHYAKLERDNHRIAHPQYRYAPRNKTSRLSGEIQGSPKDQKRINFSITMCSNPSAAGQNLVHFDKDTSFNQHVQAIDWSSWVQESYQEVKNLHIANYNTAGDCMSPLEQVVNSDFLDNLNAQTIKTRTVTLQSSKRIDDELHSEVMLGTYSDISNPWRDEIPGTSLSWALDSIFNLTA
jgi:hypothetical protein